MICDQTDGYIIHCVYLIFLSRHFTNLVTDGFHCINIKYRLYILHNNCKTLQSHTGINILLCKFSITALAISLELGKYVVPYFHVTVTVTAYLTIRLATSVFFASIIVNFRTWTARTSTMLPEVITFTGLWITVETCNTISRYTNFLGPDIVCLIILSID